MYTIGSATGVATIYLVNKDCAMPDKKPQLAFFFSSSKLDLSDCLAPTITDEKVLQENKDVMRYRMEAYITNLQGQVIKKLQELETDEKFVVDRWLRKEVC